MDDWKGWKGSIVSCLVGKEVHCSRMDDWKDVLWNGWLERKLRYMDGWKGSTVF